MEDIDGGLHPAVDGQSLDDDEMMNKQQRSAPSSQLFQRAVHFFLKCRHGTGMYRNSDKRSTREATECNGYFPAAVLSYFINPVVWLTVGAPL